jgi:hypothetical protein
MNSNNIKDDRYLQAKERDRCHLDSPSKRTAFYLRSATGDLADLGLQHQLLVREFMDRGISSTMDEVDIYEDTRQSGLRPGPEFLRMCQNVSLGKIDVVMVSRMNRISRSFQGLIDFHHLIEKHRIRFISSQENVDSNLWHGWKAASGDVK